MELAQLSDAIATVGKAVGAGLCMGIGSIAPALGEGNAVARALEGMARQPEAASNLRTNMILGCAITESTGIYSLVIALLILFAS
ncbi:MAG: ATP synthase F0 subunit C [Clostridia bacterium]|nr:ATP synthase F0 subunit C [Clostridia bacterium]